MYIGGSITLIAIGAILRWAISDTLVEGISLDVTGWILMALGFLGLVISLVQFLFLRDDRVTRYERA